MSITKEMQAAHHRQVVTAKHQARLAAGITESSPADYNSDMKTTDGAARLEALRRAEALKEARELERLGNSYA